MGIAFWAASGLVSPLQQMLGWFLPDTPQHARQQPPRTVRTTRPAAAAQMHRNAIDSGAPRACRTGAAATNRSTTQAARPLRVVRVVEEGRAPAGTGRMAISGRIADVCAELDRLAASEAARH